MPSRFARGLREILSKHDDLRAYYVEIPNVDKAATQSQPLSPPPQAPLLRLQEALRAASPESVTAELVEQTKQVLRAAPTVELDEDDRRRASATDIVHQSPRPPGAPSARQRHAHNVATLLAKLNQLGGVANLKDGVASVGALHNVDKFISEDLPALIAEILKHWPF